MEVIICLVICAVVSYIIVKIIHKCEGDQEDGGHDGYC
jgi:hypothetical protein